MAKDRFPFLAQFLRETSGKEPVKTDKTMQTKVSSVLSIKTVDLSQKNTAAIPDAGNPCQLPQTSLGGDSSVLPVASLGIPRKRTPLPQEIPQKFFRKRLRTEATKPTKPYLGGGGPCLVLADRKSRAETLVGLLEDRGVTAAMLTGDLSNRELSQVIKPLIAGKFRVLVATAQLIGEGFDAPALSAIFLAKRITSEFEESPAWNADDE